MKELLCPFEGSTYLFLSPEIPALIHYSHAVAAIAALSIGFLVFFNNPKSPVAKLMLLFVSLFTIWAALDVILWATNVASAVMFSWSLQVLIEPLTYVVAFYLFYLHLFKTGPSTRINLLFFVALLPVVLMLPTTLTLTTLYHPFCESYEGVIAEYYTYALHLIIMVSILLIGVFKQKELKGAEKMTVLALMTGLITFLLAFSSGNFLGSFTEEWVYSQYGLFGMPIFASLIAYSIVRFEAFNAKALSAQVLVFILAAAVISLATLQHITTVRVVAILTFVLVCILGYLLIKSVKKEVEQREQLEELTNKLEAANERLKELDKLKSEFVSIASHQLRSPLTAIRGYASLIIDGTYGKIPQKAMEAIERISESAKNMAYSIEDYLNVSRIESGNMKYNKADFNLRDEAEKIADDLRPQAIQKGLGLIFRTDLKSQGIINADIGKVIQIIQNLINNAIKYTPQGSIKVLVRDDVVRKKIYIDIEDTGVGIPQASIDHLFGKFERATNANSANIHGTGLGLFVAHQMATQMGGNITAQSEGEGKGSVFTIEFPLAM